MLGVSPDAVAPPPAGSPALPAPAPAPPPALLEALVPAECPPAFDPLRAPAPPEPIGNWPARPEAAPPAAGSFCPPPFESSLAEQASTPMAHITKPNAWARGWSASREAAIPYECAPLSLPGGPIHYVSIGHKFPFLTEMPEPCVVRAVQAPACTRGSISRDESPRYCGTRPGPTTHSPGAAERGARSFRVALLESVGGRRRLDESSCR